MKTVEQVFARNKIVPVVVINDISDALRLANALLEVGINNMEITLRTANALEIIALIAKQVPQMIVGAGTILTPGDFLNACNAGAKYVISPGVTSELFTAARTRTQDVRFIPGVCTPSHAMEAAAHGFNYVKFFPAEAYNGYQVIKALAAPFPHVKFCPTGGVTIENMAKYLELANVFAVGMSSIVAAELIAAHDFTEISRRCQEAMQIANLACGIK